MTLDHAPSNQAFPDRSGDRGERADVFERVGSFEIRLAASTHEVARAQRLRFGVFYREGSAVADAAATVSARDLCPFDAVCDHLLIVDNGCSAGAEGSTVVGTYRLLRREVAERHGGFYSAAEFELGPLLARHPRLRFLELGRSCVHPAYRGRRVIELLWRGLWLYARRHRVEALIGCASLPGLDLDINRRALSYLRHRAPAAPEWQVASLPHRATAFVPLPAEAVDPRRDLMALPPLVKAYLRAGAHFSADAVLDRQFGTTDVFAAMPMAEIGERYLAHYGQPSCVSRQPAA